MGLGALYGASGIDQRLRERVMQRLAEEQARQQMSLASRGADRADKQLEAQLEANRLAAQALVEQRTYTRGQAEETAARAINEQVPPGRYPASDPIMGRLVKIGAARPVDERPAVDEGPLLPGDTGAALPAGYEKLPTAMQLDRAQDNERQAAAAQALIDDRAADNLRAAEEAQSRQAAREDAAADRAADNARQMTALGVAMRTARTNEERLQLENQKAQLELEGKQRERVASRQTIEETKTLLTRMKDHPGLASSTGFFELRSGKTPASRAFNALLQQVTGRLTGPYLKGLGPPLSDRDVALARDMATRLTEARVSPEEYQQAIDDALAFVDQAIKLSSAGAPGRTRYDANGNPIP